MVHAATTTEPETPHLTLFKGKGKRIDPTEGGTERLAQFLFDESSFLNETLARDCHDLVPCVQLCSMVRAEGRFYNVVFERPLTGTSPPPPHTREVSAPVVSRWRSRDGTFIAYAPRPPPAAEPSREAATVDEGFAPLPRRSRGKRPAVVEPSGVDATVPRTPGGDGDGAATMVTVFTYGMDMRWPKELGPPGKSEVARLEGYRLLFNARGGRENITRNTLPNQATVHGGVWPASALRSERAHNF
jgi:hypothetical protein